MAERRLTPEQMNTIAEWVFDMCEEYDLPLTANTPRIQNGQQLRHAGEFTREVFDLVEGILAQHLENEKNDE